MSPSESSAAGTLKKLLNPQPGKEPTKEPGGRLQRNTKSAALENRVWLNNRPALKRTAEEQASDSDRTVKKKSKALVQKKNPPTIHANPSGGNTKARSTTQHRNAQQKKLVSSEEPEEEELLPEEDEDEDVGGNAAAANEDDDGEQEDIGDFDFDEEDLARERAKVVSGFTIGDETEFIYPGPPARGASIPEIDDYLSEASSRVDLSMMSAGDDDEQEEPAHRTVPNIKKASKAHDAKYAAELPAMVAPSMERNIQKSKGKSAAHSGGSNGNDGWPASTSLVYPQQQRVISLTAQSQTTRDLIHEAILLAIGLAIFQNGFAASDQQLVDSRNSLITAAMKRQLPEIVDRYERDSVYARHLTNYVTGRVGHMRGKVKDAAQELVPAMYGIHLIPVENNACKNFIASLLSKMNYIFPRTNLVESSTVRTNEPYRHPAIVAVMRKYFFTGNRSLGRRFQDTFSSSIDSDNSKEIPRALLGIVVVAIFAALKEWHEGLDQRQNQDFVSADFSDEYELHMALLQTKIYRNDGTGKVKYHVLMSRLYREVTMDSGHNVLASSEKMPDVDFDGMEE
ncbi:hypothetical protein F5890DRAFT_1557941 [Lentinula detonsa]|uniref:DUF6532 domain-containing protein n=1 Tax=Lentinula detonsa TaxID=2804962 RepID=A0AA38PRX5_9AGAR|nr:hypothetical protein F5890DRAFT_1557941 [Lentinula detonsa]